MYIINSDEDLRNISYTMSMEVEHSKLTELYMLPAYRCRINICKYNDCLYLSFNGFIDDRNIKDFNLGWNNTVDNFLDISSKYGFVDKKIAHNSVPFFLRPKGFTIEDENRLISELLNCNINRNSYISNKYGLK